jgi:AcrR family transcriptional regulator
MSKGMTEAAEREALREEVRSAREDIYRARLITAAEQVFAEVGFEGARMKDIANSAGLAMGTVYGVFASKDDVFAAIHDERAGALFERVASLIEAEMNPLDTILAGVAETVRFFCAHPDYLRMHLHAGVGWSTDAQPTARQSEAWQEGVAMLSEVFAEGKRQGLLAPGDPTDDARIALAMHQVLLGSYLSASPQPSVDSVVADLQERVRRAFAV